MVTMMMEMTVIMIKLWVDYVRFDVVENEAFIMLDWPVHIQQ